jgi:hypothetical protein
MAKYLEKRNKDKWEFTEEKEKEYNFPLVIAYIIAIILLLKK